jgi:2-polyprenyl-6-methoxyphenol hydroxylase-like FAD-dependent oxidoreductase
MKKIAIIGGGPSGLTLARLLQMKGFEVHVYERDKNRQVRVQGATLDLHHESGLAALQEAGLIDAFKRHYRPGADKTCLVDQKGTVVYDEPINTEFLDGERFRPEIDRGPLRDILLDSLQPDTVVWDSRFERMEPEGQGWSIFFENGIRVEADLVIGADGANSKVRPYLTDIKPFYAGIMGIEGSVYNAATVVPAIGHLLKGGKIFALGESKTLIVSSKGDGSLVFYAGFAAPENWVAFSGIDLQSSAFVKAWFAEEFKGWGAIWDTLFDQAKPPYVLRAQYCYPLDQQWTSKPNLTLVGDAAHLMPFYAGEGVNMAMLDSLELARALSVEAVSGAAAASEGSGATAASGGSVAAAIAAFEHQMLTRASAMASETLEQMAIMHSPEGLAHLVKLFTFNHEDA